MKIMGTFLIINASDETMTLMSIRDENGQHLTEGKGTGLREAFDGYGGNNANRVIKTEVMLQWEQTMTINISTHTTWAQVGLMVALKVNRCLSRWM